VANKEATLLLKIKTAGEEALDKVSSSLGAIATVGVAAFGAISAAIVKGIGEYAQQEQAVNSLTRTMVNNGIYSAQLRDAYLAQADALSKVTLFGDENIIQAQSQFSQQAKGVKLTKEATSAILDFAQAQGIDAANAAEVVGKAVGTGTNALARYGIEVTATASKSEKMAQVLAGLNSKFGGQAEAATGGLGALKLLSKSVGELFETLGEKLAPAVTWVAKELLALVNTQSFVGGFIDAISSGFNFLVKLSTSLAFAFQSLGTTIGGTFGTIAGSLQLLIKGQFASAKTALVDGFKEIASERERIQTAHNAKMAELDSLDTQGKVKKIEADKNLLIESNKQNTIINEEQRLSDRERQLNALIEDSNLIAQAELAQLSGKQSAIYEAEAAAAAKKYTLAVGQKNKTAALEDQFRATDLANQAKYDEARQEAVKSSLSMIASLSKSGNSTLATIGKAAALTQIAIDTPVAIGRALSAAPPPFNFALAAGVAAAMAAQTANVLGVPLAEGGIVLPRAGGTQATIGEAGQAEAVIPLDRMAEFGMGGGGSNITIVVNGGMLGTETEAREFAKVLDQELLKLRRNNESVSFDSGVI
jgi:hypothetical protein